MDGFTAVPKALPRSRPRMALRNPFMNAPQRIACVLLFTSTIAFAQSLQPVPALKSRVTDLTGTLSAQEQATLEGKLASFEARKGSQLAVLIVPTTEPEDIAQYGIRVADQWKLGREKSDDGALLIVAKNDRRMRIEVGYGLEGVLTDATSRRINADTITPLFRQGDFYGGITAGLDQMIRIVDGEPLPAPDRRWQDGTQNFFGALPILIVWIFIGASILRRIFGRPLGAALTGAGSGGLAWLFTFVPVIAGLAALAGFFFALLAGMSGGGGWSNPSRRGRSRGDYGTWGGIGRGGFGRGGGGFGGGGGFSGGGGGFGGGGASGSW
jgi:uncharacterized protein